MNKNKPIKINIELCCREWNKKNYLYKSKVWEKEFQINHSSHNLNYHFYKILTKKVPKPITDIKTRLYNEKINRKFMIISYINYYILPINSIYFLEY